MATISDVAFKAGVSTATVSRAFNGKSTVDPALAERVFRAATELDYRPNSLARNLRRQATTVLALIVADVENPFFTAVARGVEDCALAAGYSVVLCNSDEDVEKERRYIDVALQERMAGVVLAPTDLDTGVRALRDRRTPVVTVDRALRDDEDVDQVSVDGRTAAREATDHLLSEGYQRVACLTGPVDATAATERLEGYRDALRAGDRANDPSLEWQADFRPGGAFERTRRALDAPDPPDAVLVANSAMAIGVLEALRERNLRPGRDIGLVAFDHAPWTGALDPALSVVAAPARQVGSDAARLLLARIADPGKPAERIILKAPLTVRDSSRRA